jgi:uncharacterized protein involved in cysteine biosynthesis
MPKTPIPRCAVCAEPIGPGESSCARCAARGARPGLPAPFAAYDPERPHAPLYHYFSGLRYFLSALPYVARTSGVKRYVAAPIAITIVLIAVMVVGVVAAVMWLLGPGGATESAQLGRTVVQAVLVAVVLVGAYLLFFPLARVILAPFADKISERVETLALGEAPSPRLEAAGVARSLVEALKMLAFQTAVTLPLFLVPVAGAPLAVLAGVFFNGLGALDMAMGRKRMRFGEKMTLARRHLAFVLGLGTAVYVVMLVPVVNLFAIPLGAVAGTMGLLRTRGR